MSVIAEYNKESYDIYLKQVFIKYPGLEAQLLADFVAYKSTGNLPHYFGRDTLYEEPDDIKDAELRHIHLVVGTQVFDPAPKWVKPQTADNQTIQWYRTSNTALVYAKNLMDENHYTLMAVFTPYAHEEARIYPKMRQLAQFSRNFSEF